LHNIALSRANCKSMQYEAPKLLNVVRIPLFFTGTLLGLIVIMRMDRTINTTNFTMAYAEHDVLYTVYC
jgi:hypothetical protein